MTSRIPKVGSEIRIKMKPSPQTSCLSKRTNQIIHSCYGLSCVLQNSHGEALTPASENVMYSEISEVIRVGSNPVEEMTT